MNRHVPDSARLYQISQLLSRWQRPQAHEVVTHAGHGYVRGRATIPPVSVHLIDVAARLTKTPIGAVKMARLLRFFFLMLNQPTRPVKPSHAEPSLHCPIDHDTEPNWYYDCDRNDIA
jgi:hypothetical protein